MQDILEGRGRGSQHALGAKHPKKGGVVLIPHPSPSPKSRASGSALPELASGVGSWGGEARGRGCCPS